MIFLTLEDETGVSNVVVWPKMYETFQPAVLGGRLLKVTGRLEREGMVVHLIADHIEDRSRDLSLLGHPNDDVLGQTATKTDDVPVHLKSDAQRTRANRPNGCFRAGIFIEWGCLRWVGSGREQG